MFCSVAKSGAQSEGSASCRHQQSLYLEDGLHVTRESVPADMFAQAVCHPLVCQYGRVLVRGVSHVLEALSQQRVVLHHSHKVAISRVLCDRTRRGRITDQVRHFPCLSLMLLAWTRWDDPVMLCSRTIQCQIFAPRQRTAVPFAC